MDGMDAMDGMDNMMQKRLCGWRPDFDSIEAYGAALPQPELARHCPQLMTKEKRDALLWLPLLKVHPRWRRGAQGIGDCVSWGAELCVTMLLAIQHAKGVSQWRTEAATEPIYGGGRVEANGGRLGGWSDGSYGAAAAEWLENWGVLLREDYSGQTGNREHNLTRYDSKKAKSWGHYGCGGRDDGGRGSSGEDGLLDKVAKQFPCQAVTRVRTVDELAAALQNGYPVSVASNVGYGRMRRNSEGIARRSGRWAHQMMFGGVKWTSSGDPLFRQFNSWGSSASGPDPGIDSEAVSACSWWTTPADAETQLRQNDSWAFGDVAGFPPQKLDFLQAVKSW